MDGSAGHIPLPQSTTAPVVVQTGTAAIVDSAGNVLSRVSGFSPQQVITVAVLLLILFICGVLGYLILDAQRNRTETLAILIRTMESEAEKNRSMLATEQRANRDAITESGRLMVSSNERLASELGKLAAVVSTAFRKNE